MYPGKELDSLEIAIYSFYFRCEYNFIRTAKFITSQQKELKKINQTFFKLAANKKPKKSFFSPSLVKNNHNLVEQKRDENFKEKV